MGKEKKNPYYIGNNTFVFHFLKYKVSNDNIVFITPYTGESDKKDYHWIFLTKHEAANERYAPSFSGGDIIGGPFKDSQKIDIDLTVTGSEGVKHRCECKITLGDPDGNIFDFEMSFDAIFDMELMKKDPDYAYFVVCSMVNLGEIERMRAYSTCDVGEVICDGDYYSYCSPYSKTNPCDTGPASPQWKRKIREK